MKDMFNGALAFNQPLNFDTSKVNIMEYMFAGALAFNQPLNFDTSLVTSMRSMFYYASAFNQPLNFDTSLVTSMAYMFSASAFSQVLGWDFSAAGLDMERMFRDSGCDCVTCTPDAPTSAGCSD